MKSILERQQLLLKCLLEADEFRPVKRFAQQLSCSDKTIRNDLIYWEENGIPIERVSGKGVRIPLEKRSCVAESIAKSPKDGAPSTEERRRKILFELLEGKNERISIQSLSDQYFVSKTSIVNDLSVIEHKLKPYHLFLKKDVRGTALRGEETDIRRALVDLICLTVTKRLEPLQDEPSRIDYDTLCELETHFGKERVAKVEHMIEDAEEFLAYKITEPYYINLITHILILVDRIQGNNMIYGPTELPPKVSADSKFYSAAKQLAADIAKSFHVRLNEAEVFYLYRYLTSSGGVMETLSAEHEPYVEKIAADMIDLCLKIFPLRFSFTQSLYQALLLHLRPMLNRIMYKIYIRNPILSGVKSEFPEAMLLLKLIMIKIQLKYHLPEIREDEIAYLAVYLQNAVEEVINRKRVIIVCSSGVGTSHLLAKRIKKYFPDWTILDIISAKQLERRESFQQVDLIVATVHLHMDLGIPVAYVSALFNEEDEHRLHQMFLQKPEIYSPSKETYRMRIPEDMADVLSQTFVEPAIHSRITKSLDILVYVGDIPQKAGFMLCTVKEESSVQSLKIFLQDEKYLTENTIRDLYYWILKNI